MSSQVYQGNKLLKGANVKQNWTKERILEYKKCMNDPVYFIRKYMKIVHLDRGLVNFDLYDYQEDLIQTYTDERRVIVLSSRQSGKSITSIGFFLHYTLFNEYKTIAILANKGDSARGLLARYRLAYEALPKWLQSGVVEWNKGSVELENGCCIIAGSTSSSAVRSKSINILFLDEFAFVATNLADDFFKSVYPTVSSSKTSKVIVVSTANGLNHYHKMWDDAIKGHNNYVSKRIDWWDVPGRDEKWKEEQILATTEEQFAQEFGNEFIGSVGTLIDSSILRNMTYMDPIHENDDGLRIYKHPEKDRTYMITVDVSEGLGQDYSALSVTDITELPYEQVATYNNNLIDPLLYPDVIHAIAVRYNEAFVMTEINNMGAMVAESLYQDIEYENVMMVTQSGRNGQILGGGFSGSRTQLGLKTSTQSKRIGCSILKILIENGQYIVNDYNTVSQLTSFVRDKKTYNAEVGRNDDLVASLFIFAWITGQKYFKEEMEHNIKNNISRKQVDRVEELLVPFGIINTGIDHQEKQDPRLLNGAVWSGPI